MDYSPEETKYQDLSKEELEKISTIYPAYSQLLDAKAKSLSTFIQIRNIAKGIFEKNARVLQTNIVGRQLTINAEEEKKILAAIGITASEMETSIAKSPYFMKFRDLKLKSQLAFALPLLMLSISYHKEKKEEEARFCYLLTFLKPYASRISLIFGTYGVIEDQMLYTIEQLTEKSDLKKYSTIYEILVKKSDLSYANYVVPMTKTYIPSDKEMHVMYASGVGSRVNSFIEDVSRKYKENKGKYLNYENSVYNAVDKDGEVDTLDSNIQSDSQIRSEVVNSAINKMNMDPIDEGAVDIACKMYLKPSSPKSRHYYDLLTETIHSVVEGMAKDMPEFFTNMVSSFLFTDNPNTGRKYTMNEFKTLAFPNVMTKKVYNNPNSKDQNILKVRKTLDKMLNFHCVEYASAKSASTKRNIRAALFMYWALFLMRSSR